MKDSDDQKIFYDKKLLLNDYDLENNDSMEFLQKFNEENKNNYISNNHFELLNKNLDEIKKLSQITRDNNNNIIDHLLKLFVAEYTTIKAITSENTTELKIQELKLGIDNLKA